MSDAKNELSQVVEKMSALMTERKTIMDRYNASSAESKTLRARRMELETIVAKEKVDAKAAKATPVTEAPATV